MFQPQSTSPAARFRLGRRLSVVLTALAACLAWRAAGPESSSFAADAASNRIRIDETLPYGQRPVDYHDSRTQNSVARLHSALRAEDVRLQYDEILGYLPSLLEELDISAASQTLVFSKTALHRDRVSPEHPRAIYFNDDTYVGWVPGTEAIELAAVDPNKGAVFYQLTHDGDGGPKLARRDRCISCHVSQSTVQVPGPSIRSVLTGEMGNPLSAIAEVSHATPIADRWGGWFVTGKRLPLRHMGNRVSGNPPDPNTAAKPGNGTLQIISADDFAVSYPVSSSDVVAHFVRDHQVHGQNLLTRVLFEARFDRRSDAEDRLVRYLLFADEAPLDEPIQGHSEYSDWFTALGPFDAHGRTLREIDGQTRLFRHRLSYLIYSPSFDALPHTIRTRILRRLWEGLSGQADDAAFAHHGRQERRDIIAIVRATKTKLPDCWLAE